MGKPVQQSVRGSWGPGTSGGCPRVPSWTKNPQYLLSPSAPGSFTIVLRCNAQPLLDIGFVVLKQQSGDRGGRKTSPKVSKRELVTKTTWKPVDVQTAEVDLPPPASGEALGYIIVPCTFDPGHQAAFELSVASVAGVAFTLTELRDDSGAPSRPAVQPVTLTEANIAAANAANAANAAKASADGVPAKLPVAKVAAALVSGGAAATPSIAKAEVPVAENEVQPISEGQGLSKRQQADVARLIAEAEAAAAQNGGLYVDPNFAAGPSSLWADGRAPGAELRASGLPADPVVSWRRPAEFAADLPVGSGVPRLFADERSGGVSGVVASALLNHWLLAACNIVGGDLGVLERVFVDRSHGAMGFYLVRFYVDDPKSDDDWHVVIVDDRLPCGKDGLPCFARTPSPAVLWLPILEKAFAKYKGCYETTCGGSVEDGLLYLTGGLSREVGVLPSSDPELVDALWGQMMQWWQTSHVIGCEHRVDGEPADELTQKGLLANLPYCVIVGGEFYGHRMVRLRTFYGYSEWRGKWSDDDPSWTTQMRQLMAYRNNSEDGTFWMGFDDFVLWFNVLFTCRMADDRWTKLTMRSRWQGATAGGCCPNFATWRCNQQWLLTTKQPLRLTISLSVPAPSSASTTDHEALFPPEGALGITILKGNPGADAKRRKLLLTSADELTVRAEPRQVRRLVQDVTLEPSETPYVLLPHTFAPGCETPFTLVLRADDENDDGLPDFHLEPVRPETDWYQKTFDVTWATALEMVCQPTDLASPRDDGKTAALKAALRRDKQAAGADDDDDDDDGKPAKPNFDFGGAPPGGPPKSRGFVANPQIALKAEKVGRFFVVVDQLGVNLDGRMSEGPSSAMYPEVGVAVLASVAALDDGRLDDGEILHDERAAADSVMLACGLATSEVAYCVVPYLANPKKALADHPNLRCRVCVYSDVPFTLDSGAPKLGAEHAMKEDGTCTCWNLGKMPGQQNEMTCPILRVYNSLKKIERGLDRQLKYLDTLAPFPREAGLANRDTSG